MKWIPMIYGLFLFCLPTKVTADVQCTKTECICNNINKYLYSKKQIKNDVEKIWNLWLTSQGGRPDNPRRKNFKVYAEYVAEAVLYYQQNSPKIGGRLPLGRDTHIIIAVKIIRETAVNPKVIGKKRHEVGMLQVHGVALNNYKRKEIINNPRLGVFLGVRWLAYHAQFCNKNPMTKWKAKDWIGTLTIYGAGLSKGRINKKKCKSMMFARKRVNAAIYYRKYLEESTE